MTPPRLPNIPFELDIPIGIERGCSPRPRVPGQLRVGQKPRSCLSLPDSKPKTSTVTTALRDGCGAAGPFATFLTFVNCPKFGLSTLPSYTQQV